MTHMDLNSDMGELPGLIADGTQDKIMGVVSSINVSCGAHAGDDATLGATLAAAKAHRLAVGAHPGYPDRANFGRKAMSLSDEAVSQTTFEQLTHLATLAKSAGIDLAHIKPHGALYHEIASRPSIAEAFCRGVSRFSRTLVVVGFANSIGLQIARAGGFPTAAEAFIDRRYEADGTLRARSAPGALLATPEAALAQALEIVQHRRVTAGPRPIPLSADTLCVHSDTPGSAVLATSVAMALRNAGIDIRPFSH